MSARGVAEIHAEGETVAAPLPVEKSTTSAALLTPVPYQPSSCSRRSMSLRGRRGGDEDRRDEDQNELAPQTDCSIVR